MRPNIDIALSEERHSRLKAASLPYEFEENIKKLAAGAWETWNDLQDLPASACPMNYAQASITMHPAFASQDYYPEDFLRLSGLECVGIRQVMVHPRHSFEASSEDGELTISLIVVAPRQKFQEMASLVEKVDPDTLVGRQIQSIESIEAVSIYDRIDIPNDYFGEFFLVALYPIPEKSIDESRDEFVQYALDQKFKTSRGFFLHRDGIYYQLIKGARYDLDAIGDYAFTSNIRVPPRKTPPASVDWVDDPNGVAFAGG